MRLACLAVLCLFSCTGPAPDGRSPSPPTSGEPEPRTFVRDCQSSVYGDLGAGWRRDEVAAGPVVFVAANGYANDDPERFSRRNGGARLQKVLVVVLGGRSVEVSVAPPAQAALAYDPARWGQRNRMRFEAGDGRVRFEPCPDQRSTQFNGAFLVRGPVCVPVEVQVEGGTRATATLSFGAGDCG